MLVKKRPSFALRCIYLYQVTDSIRCAGFSFQIHFPAINDGEIEALLELYAKYITTSYMVKYQLPRTLGRGMGYIN